MTMLDSPAGPSADAPATSMPADIVDELGLRLYQDEKRARAGEPLSDAHPTMTVHDAYAIQARYASARLADGVHIVGHKIGCTNPVVQAMFKVSQPDYGHLFSDMAVADGGAVSMSRLVAPRVEPEIGFLLASPLRGPGVTATDVLLATRAIVPALEIVDSRIVDWRIRFVDTVADNGSSSHFVLGDRIVPVASMDLRLMGVVLEVNGVVAATGAGAATLGHPAAAVAWLANALSQHGGFLDAGHIVLPGAATAYVPVAAGDQVHASFAGLGTVRCRFVS